MNDQRDLSLQLEQLERRQLMAGDVSVSVVNGDLIIDGDNDNNALMIIGTGVDGQFDILAAHGTSVNGYSAISVSGATDDIRINLRNGDNALALSDAVSLDRMRIRTGNGDDTIVLERSGSKNQLDIVSGGGDDSVYLYKSGSRRINARTGAGDDEIAFDQAQTQYLNANTSGGNDEMYFGDSVIVFRGRINLGGGSDRMMFAPSTVMTTDVRITGGGGTDAFGGNNVPFQSFEVVGVTVDSLNHFIDFASGQIESQIDLSNPL